MEINSIDEYGQVCGTFDASDAIFGRHYNEALVHQIVVAYQANAREGNRAQKDRSQVNYSTRKPWRQKGTGRARAGMRSSPLWRGGGRIFPNSPNEVFTQKINKKMFRGALCSILSQLVREDRLSVANQFSIDTPKTKLLSQKLKTMGLSSVLFIMTAIDTNLLLASSNLSCISIVKPNDISPLSLIFYKKVLVTKEAVVQIEKMLS